MTGRSMAAAAAALVLGASAASAMVLHHGWADYDSRRTLSLVGTVQSVKFDNPHVVIDLQTSGQGAKKWVAVLAPPSRMRTRGLPMEDLRTGLTARVVGYPHKTIGTEMRAERIIIANDTTELR